MFGLEQMKHTLGMFGSASDLSGFDNHCEQALFLENFLSLETGVHPSARAHDQRPAMRDLVDNYQIFKLLSGAISRGIKLTVQHKGQQLGSKSTAPQTSEQRALHAIKLLVGSLTAFIAAWHKSAASEADRTAYGVKFAAQVAQTDLLRTLVKACTSTASTFEQLKQQQQHWGSRRVCELDAATSSLCISVQALVGTLEAFWPGKLLVGSTIATCIEFFNKLALAILRMPQAAAARSSSSASSSSAAKSSSSSSASSSSASSSSASSSSTAKSSSCSSSRARSSSSTDSSSSGTASSNMSTVGGVPLAVIDGAYLWLGRLAARISEDIIESTCSINSSSNTVQLAAMNPQVVRCLASDTLLQMLLANLGLATRLLHERRSSEQAAADSSAKSKQPTAGVKAQAKQQNQQQQALLPQPHHQKLLQLLDMPVLQQLELKHEVVSQMHPQQTVAVLAFACQARTTAAAEQGGSSTASASSSGGSDATAGVPALLVLLEFLTLQAAAKPELVEFGLRMLPSIICHMCSAEAAAAAAMLQALMSELGPAVLQAISEASRELAAKLHDQLFGVLCVVVATGPADLAAAIKQQPVSSCQTLEAVIRLQAKFHEAGTLWAMPDIVVYALKTDASWAAAAAVGAEAQLFALLASCLKAAAVSACSSSISSTRDKQLSMQLVLGAMQLCKSTNSKLWILLEARALQVIGQVAAGLFIADAAADPAPAAEGFTVLLEGCIDIVEGLGPKLAAAGLQGQPAAAAEALQKLMQQQQDLLQQLQQARRQQAQQQNGSSASTHGAALAGCGALTAQLAEQLQQFGAAVCTQLPQRWWCNHPGCTNLDKLSELALVGGKACICAGCTVARYCSRSCQEAHWKKQHKPVCRRLAAAQRQPAEQQQQ